MVNLILASVAGAVTGFLVTTFGEKQSYMAVVGLVVGVPSGAFCGLALGCLWNWMQLSVSVTIGQA